MEGEGKGGSGQRNTLMEEGEGGSGGVRDMASPLLGNLGAKFSKTSFPHFTTSFTQIDHCLTFR